MTASTVLILGSHGKIGRHATTAFAAAEWQVRRYVRGTGMAAAAMGADVIVNGLNPPAYHDWRHQIPEITAQVIAAARASGATVILPGNVYNFATLRAPVGEQLWGTATPQRSDTRKGQIRIGMEAAYRASGVRTIVLRAGNFIDPDSPEDLFGMVMTRRLARGRLTLMSPPDVVQTYAWLPDWARAAVALAETRATLDRFTDVPFPGHAFSGTDLARQIAPLIGREVRLRRFGWWMMHALSPVWELARELAEMRGLFQTSHRLDGAILARLLPDFRATPAETVLLSVLPGARGGASPVDVDPDKAVRSGGTTVITQ